MTFSPQAWPDIFSDQQDFIRSFELGLLDAESLILPPTIHSSSEPTRAQFEAAWAEAYPDNPAVPDYARMLWYNPAYDQIENSYILLPQAGNNIVDVSHKTRNEGLEFIGEYLVTVSGDTGMSVANIPQTYRDLLIFITSRASNAATSATWLFRVQALATLYYYGQHSLTNSTFVGAEVINGTSLALNVPAATLPVGSGHTPGNAFASTMIWLRNYADATKIPYGHFLHTYFNVAGSDQPQQLGGGFIRNGATPIDNVSVTPTVAASIEKGSHLVVYGIK